MNTEDGIKIFSKKNNIFLLDAIGAALSALMLLAVLTPFHIHIGLPKHILLQLGFIAVLFFIYSFGCYLLLKHFHLFYLKIITGANTAYCLLTTVVVICYFSSMTRLGISYFIIEILLILALVFLELKIIKKVKAS